MSCRMTLIDSVAPFGLFSWRPFGKVAQQTGFPAAPTRLGWIQSTYSLCSPVSSPFLDWPLSLFIAIASLCFLKLVYIVQSIWCFSRRHKCLLHSPQPSVCLPAPQFAAHVTVIPPQTNTTTVVAFTTALFLSGYVIQQRTVGHLRAAIRPNPAPQIYIPDRFRQDTTELADGTIVVLDEYNRPTRQKIAGSREPGGQNYAVHESDKAEPVVEVKETPADSLGEQQQQRVLAIEQLRQETENAQGREQHQEKLPPVETKPQPAPWEVRAEVEQTSNESNEHPDDETKKPVSRAERRRLIKEEIMRLSQGDEPVYYQRRLY